MNQELYEETKNQKISTNSASYPSFQEKVKVNVNGLEIETIYEICFHKLEKWNIVREIWITARNIYCTSMIEIYYGGSWIRYVKLFRRDIDKIFHTIGTITIKLENTDLSRWWTDATALIETIKSEGVVKTYQKIFEDLRKLVGLLEL
jgi:hypothetical protein